MDPQNPSSKPSEALRESDILRIAQVLKKADGSFRLESSGVSADTAVLNQIQTSVARAMIAVITPTVEEYMKKYAGETKGSSLLKDTINSIGSRMKQEFATPAVVEGGARGPPRVEHVGAPSTTIGTSQKEMDTLDSELMKSLQKFISKNSQTSLFDQFASTEQYQNASGRKMDDSVQFNPIRHVCEQRNLIGANYSRECTDHTDTSPDTHGKYYPNRVHRHFGSTEYDSFTNNYGPSEVRSLPKQMTGGNRQSESPYGRRVGGGRQANDGGSQSSYYPSMPSQQQQRDDCCPRGKRNTVYSQESAPLQTFGTMAADTRAMYENRSVSPYPVASVVDDNARPSRFSRSRERRPERGVANSKTPYDNARDYHRDAYRQTSNIPEVNLINHDEDGGGISEEIRKSYGAERSRKPVGGYNAYQERTHSRAYSSQRTEPDYEQEDDYPGSRSRSAPYRYDTDTVDKSRAAMSHRVYNGTRDRLSVRKRSSTSLSNVHSILSNPTKGVELLVSVQ